MAAALWFVFGSTGARAAEIPADPSTFQAALPKLKAGDTLRLAAGTYPHFSISGLNGTSAGWITIAGPASDPAAIVEADPGPCCNTIEITGSSFVAIEHLTIDGKNIDGAFGLSASGTASPVHDIRVEGCTFLNHHGGQQHDAISTKTPTWGWIIRNNRISSVGTGLYLGNSTGDDPFIGGVIEGNLVENPIGYCMEIKFQRPRTAVAGMPTGPSSTIIRNNVFIKNDDPSPDGDRPNVLVGGFPDTGPGSMDRYEIYGNVFFHNPRESLLQASGRVTVHDNLFVDVSGTALLLQNHDLPLRLAYVYNNTVYGAGTGIAFGSSAAQGDAVIGNLVFAATPIRGSIQNQKDNLIDATANAASYVKAPSLKLGAMDFYPLPGKCQGTPLDLALMSNDIDYAIDFNRTSKGDFKFRGAYAGEGANPGWAIGDGLKSGGPAPHDGGAPQGGGGASGSVDAAGGMRADGSGVDGSAATDARGGCGCRVGAGPAGDCAFALPWLVAIVARRRSRRARPVTATPTGAASKGRSCCRGPERRPPGSPAGRAPTPAPS